MQKKMRKSDSIFLIAVIACLILHCLCIFTPLPYNDEALYPTVPFRFINGDIMLQHEWHTTQFSSVFQHLPVLFWLTFKGSTEGILLFLRILYLIIHTLSTFIIYKFFRNYKLWAVAASMLFYTQVSYRMLTISYATMITLFLLLFSLCLLRFHKKRTSAYLVFAGVCFGACCVCNPLYCILYPIYVVACIKSNRKLKHNIYCEQDIQTADTIPQKFHPCKNCSAFFELNSFVLVSVGIGIMAVICIIYFLSTGGSFTTIPNDIKNLFSATEYDIIVSVKDKFSLTTRLFNEISLNMPFLLPSLYIMLLLDKNRNNNAHKIAYLILSLSFVFLYIYGITSVFLKGEENAFAVPLPLTVFSTVCYILTKKKNQLLFYCMWCPGMVGAFIQYLTSNTNLTAFSLTLVVANIAGVIFIKDFFAELCDDLKLKSKKQIKTYSIILCLAICSQLIFNCFLYQYDRIPNKEEYTQVTYGPLAHFYLNDSYYESYTNSLSDLDIIKSRCQENDPVLITSRMGWMYLYVDQPIAAYSTCLLTLDADLLNSYYAQNPDKMPKYIYVGFADTYYKPDRDAAFKKVSILEKMFNCTKEELSMGVLLTVNT